MKRKRRILTFNWHESYLYLLAATGHDFTVARPDLGRNGKRDWDERLRPVPANVTLVDEADALAALANGAFDLSLAQNFRDLALVVKSPTPSVMLFHNSLTGELALGANTVRRRQFLSDVGGLIDQTAARAFVSESKQNDWDLSSRSVVIPHGVDQTPFPLAQGEGDTTVLRVGNRMKARDIMMGWSLQERIIDEIPSLLLGAGDSATGSRVCESFDELVDHYQRHRIYLHTTLAPFEDGFNLALLEAMSCGMGVISYRNPTSPIIDGINGYLSEEVSVLRRRIAELTDDPVAARRLGVEARNTVARLFPFEPFLARWNDLFDAVAEGRTP